LNRLGPPIRQTQPPRGDEFGLETAIARRQRGKSEAARQLLARHGRHAARQAMFDRIRALYNADRTIREIAEELGPGLRRVRRWVRLIELPERDLMAPKPSTTAYHGAYLTRRWAEGTTKVK